MNSWKNFNRHSCPFNCYTWIPYEQNDSAWFWEDFLSYLFSFSNECCYIQENKKMANHQFFQASRQVNIRERTLDSLYQSKIWLFWSQPKSHNNTCFNRLRTFTQLYWHNEILTNFPSNFLESFRCFKRAWRSNVIIIKKWSNFSLG